MRSSLPPLLAISDASILLNSRTHKTYCDETQSPTEGNLSVELRSYKRLETLGDTLISAHVTLAIMHHWPHFGSAAISVSASFPDWAALSAGP